MRKREYETPSRRKGIKYAKRKPKK